MFFLSEGKGVPFIHPRCRKMKRVEKTRKHPNVFQVLYRPKSLFLASATFEWLPQERADTFVLLEEFVARFLKQCPAVRCRGSAPGKKRRDSCKSLRRTQVTAANTGGKSWKNASPCSRAWLFLFEDFRCHVWLFSALITSYDS